MGPLQTWLNRKTRIIVRARKIESRARLAHERGEETRATTMFLKALTLLEANPSLGTGVSGPEYASTLASIGRGLYLLERASDAERAANAALALDPENLDALDCRGLVLASRGNSEEARASFTRALAVDPART